MADLSFTSAQVRSVQVKYEEIYDYIAGVAIDAGQAVYFNTTTGKLAIADASADATAQARGIALRSVAAGQVVSVMKRGIIAGFDLTSQSYDDRIFLSDTAGDLADAAGTVTVPCGRVISRPDASLTKALYIDFSYTDQFAA